jgi:hypothetical protein
VKIQRGDDYAFHIRRLFLAEADKIYRGTANIKTRPVVQDSSTIVDSVKSSCFVHFELGIERSRLTGIADK